MDILFPQTAGVRVNCFQRTDVRSAPCHAIDAIIWPTPQQVVQRGIHAQARLPPIEIFDTACLREQIFDI
jgi:hypothetical protein